MKVIPRLLFGLVLSTIPALCTPVDINLNQWYQFDWTGHQNDLATAGVGTPAPPWTFTLSGAGTFELTDILLNQQQFSVYDNGIFLMTSTFPSSAGNVNCGSDPAVCFNTAGMSRMSLALGAGSHSITIRTQMDLSTAGTPNIGSGIAYFEVLGAGGTGTSDPPSSVPEPTSLSLIGLGFGVGGVLLRRRKRT